jgi:simple sugar transport system permease protein
VELVLVEVLKIATDPLVVALVLWVLGNIVVERSGVINLALDGIITIGIAVAFVSTQYFGYFIGLLITIVTSLAFATMFMIFINIMHTYHVLTGLALNILFYGLSALIGLRLQKSPVLATLTLSPVLLALVSILAVLFTWFILYKTSIGIAIRACGFNPRASEHLGIKVWRTRFLASTIGYTLAGIGSYIYATVYRGGWVQYTGRGYGFLAITLAMASTWHPLLSYPISLVFGYLYTSIYALQLLHGIHPEIVNAIPYVASIAIVTIVYSTPLHKKLAAPRALGEVYFKEERAA